MITITLEIPDGLASQLAGDTPHQLSRQALEALVLDAYRENRLGGVEGAEVLGFSRLEWNHFLKEKRVLENAYSVEDLERDVATIQRLRAEGVLPAA